VLNGALEGLFSHAEGGIEIAHDGSRPGLIERLLYG
jgi:hypothetical protein